ncbi:DNA-binding FadR family transcriptional regulator [Maritimibacter alkaliphilus HTCC2654]|uniref:Transcriptional regulator, putative pyruvate dehydrogenase complex repressor n=2 Tax=Maritimibacter TaxID=404235 RepID=A3VLP5_9RHOB|nr:transcriptional regulator, putative pyruvate dehydrogenase complex repressor [Rhodobacterales bacterium HTCC2654] [Maritimibacter alkaliphilus HTCC2654]TYP80525.1 DNA-binding FadR family transcriptional regulator [Maritimibacter alkaliphilus HTCC2654]
MQCLLEARNALVAIEPRLEDPMTAPAKRPEPPVFEPVKQNRNFEVVVQVVREKMMRGELKPGDKLPPERELAKQLDVSRNVVREALRILENAGLVVTRKGAYGGAFVSEGTATQMSQVLSDLIMLNAIKLSDLFEARTLLLEMILDQIKKRGTIPDLTALDANLVETEEAVTARDSARRVAVARDFYHQIAALTGNTALVYTTDAQTELTQTFLQFRIGDMAPEVLLNSRRNFVEHLRAGRVDEAKEELRAHLDRVHTGLWERS